MLVREVLHSESHGHAADVAAVMPLSAIDPLVQRVIGRSLDELSADARRLLTVGAVAGGPLDVDLLASLTGIEEDDVVDLLDEARTIGIVCDGPGLDQVRFDHEMLSEHLASRVSASRVARIHRRAAEVFASRGESSVAVRHALLAASTMAPDLFTSLAAQGADAALAGLAFEAARTICADALAAYDDVLGDSSRADLLLRLGRSEALSGNPDEAEAPRGDERPSALAPRKTLSGSHWSRLAPTCTPAWSTGRTCAGGSFRR